jgi:hypothetical protein
VGLLDDFGEYLRRSGRNLGMAADAALANAASNNARARDSAGATLLQMRGADLNPSQQDALHNPPYGGFGTDAGAPGGGLLGTFAGVASKTANKQMLGKAKAALKRGEDAETVRQRFGWFQDPTGDWKYEISDHRAQLATDETGRYRLDHPELRRAYPDLLDSLKIDEMPGTDNLGRANPTVADYTPSTNTARVNPSRVANPEAALRALMHEVQHGVQDVEGHSPGTSQHSAEVNYLVGTEYASMGQSIIDRQNTIRQVRDGWLKRNPDVSLDDFYRQYPGWAKAYDDLLAEARNLPTADEFAFNKYNSALGEVEARDTMNRLRLTPDQRKKDPPYRGEGIPQDRIWDTRAVARQLPTAAEEPFQGLLDRALESSPEARGTLLSPELSLLSSLLGIPLLPSDAQ